MLQGGEGGGEAKLGVAKEGGGVEAEKAAANGDSFSLEGDM